MKYTDFIVDGAVIDKIIEEIEDSGAYEQKVNGHTEYLKGINYCLSVIEKFMEEEI